MSPVESREHHPDEEALAALALAPGDERPEAADTSGTTGAEDVPAAVREHVASCTACTTEVEALRETAEMLARITPAEADSPLTEPPARVWAAVEAETRPAGTVHTTRLASPTRPGPGPAGGPGPSRRPWLLVAAAVVAGVLVGGAGDRLLAGSGEPAPTATSTPGSTGTTSSTAGPSVLARIPLTQVDGQATLGDAVLLRDGDVTELRVDTSAPPGAPPGGGYREVWLLNVDGERMVAVGVLAGRTETFAVPRGLLRRGYRVVDVSSEPADGNPAHSGDSIMRGTLPA